MIGRSHGSIMHGTNVPFLSATVASARTQRDTTERVDHNTTTAFADRSAASVTSSYASPARSVASHHTSKPCAAKPCAKSFADVWSSRL
jgi:hypothetical protein